MSDNAKEQDQLGLWDEATSGSVPQRRRPRKVKSNPPTIEANPTPQPPAPRTPPSLPERRPTRPMEFQELWDIDQVSNYLGVPQQTIYGWRHTGKGPKGFRVGKHVRWHARTVIAWTLGLEREQ